METQPRTSPAVRFLDFDDDIRKFSAVLVGRQASRASVIGAFSGLILSPLVAPLIIDSAGDTPSASAVIAQIPLPIFLVFAVLVSALALTVALWGYRLLYRGSKKIISFLKWATRITLPIAFLYLLIPLFVASHARTNPPLTLYAVAMTVSVVIGIWFTLWTNSYVTAWRHALDNPAGDYQFFAPGNGHSFSFMLREMFAVPPGWLVERKKVAWIVALMAIVLLLEGLSFSFILRQLQSVANAFRDDLPNIDVLDDSAILSSVLAFALPLLSFPLLALAGRLRRAARRAAVHSMAEVRAKDGRAPLLFLRSFSDDQVGLTGRRSRHVFERILARGSAFANVDELLTERYWHVGPVLAIGKPGEAMPPLGAARAYLAGGSWQVVVANLMREAGAIVVVLDYTEGVNWELRQARSSGCLTKSLLLIPPHRHGDSNLVRHALAILGVRGSGAVDAMGPVIAILPTPSGLVVCSSREADSYAYDFVMRVGFHAVMENRTDLLGVPSRPVSTAPPAPTRRRTGPIIAAMASIAVVFVALAVVVASRSSAPVSVQGAPPASPTRTAPPAAKPIDPAQALQQEVVADRATAESLVGYWVPQISSKQAGLVVDGTTYNDDRIWADFERSSTLYPNAVLVRSEDFS